MQPPIAMILQLIISKNFEIVLAPQSLERITISPVYLDGMILHAGEKPTDWLTAYYYCKKKKLTLSVILTPGIITLH